MKSLKKLHAEAIGKAKTEQDKIKAAAVAMIEKPMELIEAILLKHEQAVIEVMRELHEENVKLKNREWVGLTDEELRHAYGEVSGNEWCLGGISNAETFYDVIEAKLKEKNRD